MRTQIGLLFLMPLALFALDSNIEPVPEPASMVLMGAGLGAMAYLGWKKNKKK